MSTIEVKLVKVDIKPHPNADKLELAYIGGEGGYISVVGKGQFKAGDLAIYVPDDSVVPPNIETVLVTKNKVTIKGGRIRCTRIRQVFSEGLCLTPSDWLEAKDIKEDNDVTEILGIKKYEPPPPSWHGGIKSGKGINFNYVNPNFPEYWCVQHLKKYPKVLVESDEVVATIKWHGTNFRAGFVRRPKTKGWWNKVKEFFTRPGEFEYLVGSHEKIKKLSANAITHGARETDTYWRAADKYNLEFVTKNMSSAHFHGAEVIIYAEVIGPGIQKGYDYGVNAEDLEIRVFDIMVDRRYLDWDNVVEFCDIYNLPTVQEVYRGPYTQDIRKLSVAVDEYNGKKYVREGIVIRPVHERKDPHCGRVIFKFLSEVYLMDKTNSEYH